MTAALVLAVAVAFVVKVQTHAPAPTPEKYAHIDVTQFPNGADIFITPLELKQQLGSKDLVILDGSHPKVYAKGHIPGALSIGFKGLSDSSGKPGDPEWGTILPKEKLTEKLESLGINNDKLVVAYSDTFKGPGAGGRAVWQMRMAGLTNVRLLVGGLEVWKRSGFPLSEEIVTPVPVQGLALKDYDESFRVKKEYLQKALGTVKIVDVRSLKEYTGENTSHGEARGGHIQGARWLEWTQLLNEDATPKSPQEIIPLLAKLGITPQDDFVLY